MCEVESQGLPGHGGAPGVSCPEADIHENGTEALGELEPTPGESPGSRRSSKSSRESLGVTPRTSQELIVKDSPVDEGVDPFSSRLTPGSSSPSERRGSKTVNFKELENEDEEEVDASQAETDRARSRSSSISTSSSATSSSKALSPGSGEEGTAGVTRRQRSLGDANPVYRLSMKLSPNLFNMTDIPGASQHREPEKAGYLTKLSGRSFPYIPQWKRRYCVLAKGKLYYYEREDSKAGDKSNGVINLEYFDQVAEAGPKDCKKATNVFIITSQDRSFFDPGRHLFSADTLPDMKDWIRKLQSALDQIRNNNRPATSTSSSVKEGGKRRKEDNAENKENVQTATKERKKKKEDSYRARKSTRVGVSSESQTEAVMAERDSEPPLTPPHKGVQLPGMSALKGIQLPGMVPTEASRPAAASTPTEVAKEPEDNEDGLPTAGPTLTCVTKQRVKGPQGRRAPQNRRTLAAAALKNRASSLSALEYQELNDNRSESSQGNRGSSRDSKSSKSSENDVEKVEDKPEVRTESWFNDIDSDLFFSKNVQERAREGHENGPKRVSKRSSTLKVNFEEKNVRKPRTRSRNGSLLGSKLSRMRETFVSIKRNRFESKEPIGASHPDETDTSRWTCSIL